MAKISSYSSGSPAVSTDVVIIARSGANYKLTLANLATLLGFTAASTTEVLTGTDTAKGVTPDALAALWEKGSDIASAATITLTEGGYFHITGTTTITDIDWDTAKNGRGAWVVFDGILTLTHNATTLKLPGGANITTAANDRAYFIQDSDDNVICLAYIKADGTSVVSGGFTAASTTEVLTGTDTTKGVTPDSLAALWEKGADEASTGTLSFGEGGFFHITGTTTITDIDWDTAKNGRFAWVIFDGALLLTHNGTTLILPGAANITTVAGDRALFIQDAADNVYCIAYVRAAGTRLIAIAASLTVVGEVELATTAEIDTGTDSTRAMPVDQFVASARNVRYINIRVLDKTTNNAAATTVGGDFECPITGTIIEIGAYVDTAGTTGTETVDVNKNGTTIISTKITIDSTEKSSRTAAAPPVISVSSIAAGDLITIDIDAIQTTPAKGLTVRLGIRMT